MKKKYQTTLKTNESHPKFIDRQNQIQCLATEIKHMKTCNTLCNCNKNKSTEIAEQNPKARPFFIRTTIFW